jgi:hypothetical protein
MRMQGRSLQMRAFLESEGSVQPQRNTEDFTEVHKGNLWAPL